MDNSDNSTFDKCCICFEEYGDNNLATLKCGHKFHLSCISTHWFEEGYKDCPYCKDDQHEIDEVNWYESDIEENEHSRTPKERLYCIVFNIIDLFVVIGGMIFCTSFLILPMVYPRYMYTYSTVNGTLMSHLDGLDLYKLDPPELTDERPIVNNFTYHTSINQTLFCWMKRNGDIINVKNRFISNAVIDPYDCDFQEVCYDDFVFCIRLFIAGFITFHSIRFWRFLMMNDRKFVYGFLDSMVERGLLQFVQS